MGLTSSHVTTANIHCTIAELPGVVKKCLEDYEAGGIASFQEGIQALGKAAAKIVKEAAPVRTGQYAASITSQFKSKRLGGYSTVYARAPRFRLTHLLEEGHYLVYFGYRTGKTVKAFPHWWLGQEWIDANWYKMVENAWCGAKGAGGHNYG